MGRGGLLGAENEMPKPSLKQTTAHYPSPVGRRWRTCAGCGPQRSEDDERSEFYLRSLGFRRCDQAVAALIPRRGKGDEIFFPFT
jgi:hypothetical protein